MEPVLQHWASSGSATSGSERELRSTGDPVLLGTEHHLKQFILSTVDIVLFYDPIQEAICSFQLSTLLNIQIAYLKH